MKTSPAIVVVLLFVQGLAGCGGRGSSLSPSAPSTAAVPPQPVPPGVAPVIAAITPRTVSTAGGAWGTITGTEFLQGASVAVGGAAVSHVSVDNGGVIHFVTVAHPRGAVDVVVTNPNGLRDTMARGLTFESPAAFDFSGTWVAHAGPDYEIENASVGGPNGPIPRPQRPPRRR